jgi:hypothetical protein
MKKLLLVVVIVALAVPLFIKGPDGKPIMDFSDWLPSAPDVLETAVPTEYFRYRDSSGNWQYTDRPPAGVEYEMVEVNTSLNNMDATPLPQTPPDTSSGQHAAGVAGYVQNLQNAKQEAEQVQQVMDGREAQLEEMLKQSQ